MLIQKKHVKASFSAVTYHRGKKYYDEGRVFDLTLDKYQDGNVVSGTVLGGGNMRYFTEAWISEGEFITDCECSDSDQCKHGAALILQAYDNGLFLDPTSKDVIEPVVKKSNMQSWFENAEQKNILTKSSDTQSIHEDFLVYVLSTGINGLEVEVRKTKRNKHEGINKGVTINLKSMTNDVIYNCIDDYVTQLDCEVFNNMSFSAQDVNNSFEIYNAARAQVLIKMVATGRCFWQTTDTPPFSIEPMKQKFEFKWTDNAPYTLEILVDQRPDYVLLPTTPMHYLNVASNKIGQISTMLTPKIIEHLNDLPPLSEDDAKQFSMWVFDRNLPITVPVDLNVVEFNGDFKPLLHIDFDEKLNHYFAKFYYQYDEFVTDYNQYESMNPTVFKIDEQLHRWHRDLGKERSALLMLRELGLNDPILIHTSKNENKFVSEDVFFWTKFKDDAQEILESAGWEVILNNVSLPEIYEIDHAQGDVSTEASEFDNWFELGLSVTLNGEKIDLVPLLIDGLANIEDWENLPDKILVPNKGDFLKFNKTDIEPIIRILNQLTNKDGKIGRYHADVLNHIPFVNTWSGSKKIQSLAKKLKDFSGITAIDAPKGLQAELREYQQQGLNWINFLQEYGFGGILADDMGLGKTVQALSMMQVLYNADKITEPMMVVCPTSLIGNWRNEAAKFAPNLKVLVLHGPQRHDLFDRVADYHLVITTYPLIHRDIEVHMQRRWLWLVLDEAQVIKNPKAKMTQAIKQLKAHHRICMTGTPMENHLGELWSLFDFLMPGFLNNNKRFNELYRKPIEEGDKTAQNWLNERIKPFLLRRTKDAVATELPNKTEIIQYLDMPSDQRRLYESIRVTMEKRVRQLLKEKGIAKSQIEFLDALLKLRQACCHPQLVKLPDAEKVQSSAKLEFLLDTLPEMIAEGRKILIFSQFAQMLKIIESTLTAHNIETTKLTGQTRKREEAIERFTSGEVDVFLISLKAGGVGLNLTQADTVIHFDPWWNPAAESQATDRAYRIGQDKPVFVYKLVTQNSIEERVLELQKQKQRMAQSVYDNKSGEMESLNGDQLLSLFDINPS
ncbi:SNF2-related protein [Marinicellulosiphila megalodicopiae]|uniref:DEAD/DEAH box helicase n=1 Tax=Marinicellulosiphila megalodicopiae TaxID=2724896 RepID=UPI003BB1241D